MGATASAPVPPTPTTPSGATEPRRPAQVDRGSVHHASLRAGRWSAAGIAKVDHDVSVGRADLRGTVVVGGTLLAGEVEVRGSLDVRGPIAVTARMRLRGSLEAHSGVRAAELSLSGKIRTSAELVAEKALRVDGALRAPELRSALLELRGVARVPGTIEATSLDARFTGDTELGEVRARQVRLRGPVPNVVRWVLGKEAVVQVARVEAESVFLEGVRVGFARSPSIVLGRDAHLLAHEGTVLRAHATSHLGPESWTPPPRGFRR